MIAAMTYDLFLAFLGFAFVTSVTPGPNNMMLMASGANFGFQRTLPHMVGISAGFSLMVLLVGLGLMGVIRAVPQLMTGLKIVSVIYLLWLAWKIAQSSAPKEGAAAGQPLSFIQAAAFQWVNPKAWTMALGAISAYAPDSSIKSCLIIATVFGLVNLPTVSLWAFAGQNIRRFLSSAKRLRMFNFTMAGLLVLSLLPVLFP